MSWSRQNSRLEVLLVEVLLKAHRPLTLKELVDRIQAIDSSAFGGTTPANSLYSLIVRREKRRQNIGLPPLIVRLKRQKLVCYQLNEDATDMAGKKISTYKNMRKEFPKK